MQVIINPTREFLQNKFLPILSELPDKVIIFVTNNPSVVEQKGIVELSQDKFNFKGWAKFIDGYLMIILPKEDDQKETLTVFHQLVVKRFALDYIIMIENYSVTKIVRICNQQSVVEFWNYDSNNNLELQEIFPSQFSQA